MSIAGTKKMSKYDFDIFFASSFRFFLLQDPKVLAAGFLGIYSAIEVMQHRKIFFEQGSEQACLMVGSHHPVPLATEPLCIDTCCIQFLLLEGQELFFVSRSMRGQYYDARWLYHPVQFFDPCLLKTGIDMREYREAIYEIKETRCIQHGGETVDGAACNTCIMLLVPGHHGFVRVTGV